MAAEDIEVAPTELERLAYDVSVRTLDKQEALLAELRSRTGVLLAASSLATSFLGQEAFRRPSLVAMLVIVCAFVLSIGACVFILLPTSRFIFSLVGPSVYEQLYPLRENPGEIYRRLAYDLDRFWEANDQRLQSLFQAYRIAAAGLVTEIVTLAIVLSGRVA